MNLRHLCSVDVDFTRLGELKLHWKISWEIWYFFIFLQTTWIILNIYVFFTLFPTEILSKMNSDLINYIFRFIGKHSQSKVSVTISEKNGFQV